MEERLRQLERRIAELEATVAAAAGPGAGGVLMVPVRVVDAEGQLVLEIVRGGVRLFNRRGVPVVGLHVEGEGGSLTIRDHDGALVGYLDVEDYGARLQVNHRAGKGGVTLFGGQNVEASGAGINIWSPDEVGSTIGLWNDGEAAEIRLDGPHGTQACLVLRATAQAGEVSATDAGGGAVPPRP